MLWRGEQTMAGRMRIAECRTTRDMEQPRLGRVRTGAFHSAQLSRFQDPFDIEIYPIRSEQKMPLLTELEIIFDCYYKYAAPTALGRHASGTAQVLRPGPEMVREVPSKIGHLSSAVRSPRHPVHHTHPVEISF